MFDLCLYQRNLLLYHQLFFDLLNTFINITDSFSDCIRKSRCSISNTFVSLLEVHDISIRINNKFCIYSKIFIVFLIIFHIFPLVFSSDLAPTLSPIVLVSSYIRSSIFQTHIFLLYKSKNCVCSTYYSH